MAAAKKVSLERARELQANGQYKQAEEAYQALLLRSPKNFDVLHGYGLLCNVMGKPELARDLLATACVENPGSVQAFTNLGMVLAGLGDLDTALGCYHKALTIKPDNLVTLINTATLLYRMERLEDAEHFYGLALHVNPEHPEALYGLASTMKALQEKNKWLDTYKIKLTVNFLQVGGKATGEARFYRLAGDILANVDREQAILQYRKALAIEEGDGGTYCNLGNAYRDRAEITKAIKEYRDGLRCGYLESGMNAMMVMNYGVEYGNADFLEAARDWAAGLRRADASNVHFPNGRNPDRRLKIGYVSGDLRHHPVGFFFIHVARHHSDEFEVHCFDTSPRNDELAAEIRAQRLQYHDVSQLSEDDLLALWRKLEIDVLVDLSGYTAYNRLPVFARRAAPVQATWLGYFGTTGLDEMDYILADRFVVPEGEERFYTERVVRLPDSYVCFSPPGNEIQIAEEAPQIKAGRPTFGCFNNRAKMSDACLDLWARVLRAVPDSQMILKFQQFIDLGVCRDILDKFEARGVDRSRISTQAPSERESFLSLYNEVDVALDPFPFGGGTTTAETLWMGVPVVTLRGDRWVGRVSESMLNSAGLPDLVAADADEYVELAVKTVADVERLNHLRRTLRQQVLASPLCDGLRFTRNLENVLRSLWRTWCERENAA